MSGEVELSRESRPAWRVPLIVFVGLSLALALILVPRLAPELPRGLRRALFPLGAVLVAGVGSWLAGQTSLLGFLGLTRLSRRGLGVAVVGSAAMGLGLALGADSLPTSVDWGALWRGAVKPGFFEELLFRGFAFGLLRWVAGWSFPVAMITTALLFGSFHVPSAILGGHADQVLGAVAVTAAGGGWFAWLYERWERSLWVPIATHTCMNAWWVLFTAGPTAGGGGPGAIWGRVAAIVLITVATLRWAPPTPDSTP